MRRRHARLLLVPAADAPLAVPVGQDRGIGAAGAAGSDPMGCGCRDAETWGHGDAGMRVRCASPCLRVPASLHLRDPMA